MVRAQASLGSQTPIQMHPQLVPASLLVLSILPGTWLACGRWKGCEGGSWFIPCPLGGKPRMPESRGFWESSWPFALVTHSFSGTQ